MKVKEESPQPPFTMNGENGRHSAVHPDLDSALGNLTLNGGAATSNMNGMGKTTSAMPHHRPTDGVRSSMSSDATPQPYLPRQEQRAPAPATTATATTTTTTSAPYVPASAASSATIPPPQRPQPTTSPTPTASHYVAASHYGAAPAVPQAAAAAAEPDAPMSAYMPPNSHGAAPYLGGSRPIPPLGPPPGPTGFPGSGAASYAAHPSGTSLDALAGQISRMQHLQDWVLYQKEQECAALNKKIRDDAEEIQRLRVENALLKEKLNQQEERMQHELKLIKIAAFQKLNFDRARDGGAQGGLGAAAHQEQMSAAAAAAVSAALNDTKQQSSSQDAMTHHVAQPPVAPAAAASGGSDQLRGIALNVGSTDSEDMKSAIDYGYGDSSQSAPSGANGTIRLPSSQVRRGSEQSSLTGFLTANEDGTVNTGFHTTDEDATVNTGRQDEDEPVMVETGSKRENSSVPIAKSLMSSTLDDNGDVEDEEEGDGEDDDDDEDDSDAGFINVQRPTAEQDEQDTQPEATTEKHALSDRGIVKGVSFAATSVEGTNVNTTRLIMDTDRRNETYADAPDDATNGRTAETSTYGEDREFVRDKLVADPYGDQGRYTGVVLRSTGMPHGEGKMLYREDNRTYEGDWRHGRWHGSGSATFANGDQYKGEYRYDQRHGRGVYSWADGRVFDGIFREDKRHGKGRFIWPDGAEYDGFFVNGQREGQGIYKFSDGGRYEGGWKDGRYNGWGICSWQDGRTYRGEWQNGMAHGKGIETFADGSVRHDGLWIEDEPVAG